MFLTEARSALGEIFQNSPPPDRNALTFQRDNLHE